MLVGSIEFTGIDDTIGVAAKILGAVPARNAARVHGRDRYEIDPRDLRALKLFPGEHLLGYFHSHPDGVARPSQVDLNCARGVYEVIREFPFYLIAAVNKQTVTDVTCWRLSQSLERFEEISLKKI